MTQGWSPPTCTSFRHGGWSKWISLVRDSDRADREIVTTGIEPCGLIACTAPVLEHEFERNDRQT